MKCAAMAPTIILVALVSYAERNEYWLCGLPGHYRPIAVGRAVPWGMTIFDRWQRSYKAFRWQSSFLTAITNTTGIKKAHLVSQVSLKSIESPKGVISNWTLTYLSLQSARKELAPSPLILLQIKGRLSRLQRARFPSAFLDKYL